jgi:hypothetical protein
MLRQHAHEYVMLGRWMYEHGGRLYMAEDELDDPGKPLSEREQEALKAHLLELLTVCSKLGLKAARLSIERALRDLPKTSREFRIYTDVLMDELKSQLFLFIPSERSSFYESAPHSPAFPAASKELTRAGNCFAVAEFTACVFHATRAVEIGLDAVHVNLSLPARSIKERSWGTSATTSEMALGPAGKRGLSRMTTQRSTQPLLPSRTRGVIRLCMSHQATTRKMHAGYLTASSSSSLVFRA